MLLGAGAQREDVGGSNECADWLQTAVGQNPMAGGFINPQADRGAVNKTFPSFAASHRFAGGVLKGAERHESVWLD
jgi:hypothetical protein